MATNTMKKHKDFFDDILKYIYICSMFLFTMFFGGFSLFKKKNIVFMVHFFEHSERIIYAIHEVYGTQYNIVVLYTNERKETIANMEKKGIRCVLCMEHEPLHISRLNIKEKAKHTLMSVKIVSRAKLIICDDYFVLPSTIFGKRKVRIMQIWHSIGALKSFGFGSPETNHRTRLSKYRFQKVYNTFDDIILGSEEMGEKFCEYWNIKASKCVYLGNTYTDVYNDYAMIQKRREYMYEKYPQLKKYRVIVYLPTFRKSQKAFQDAIFTQEELEQILTENKENAFITRFHPHARFAHIKYADITDHNERYLHVPAESMLSILSVADCVITDYSSVVFDFLMLKQCLNRKEKQSFSRVILYAKDYEYYKKTVGVVDSKYTQKVFGPSYQKVTDVTHALRDLCGISEEDVEVLLGKYNDGQATERLVTYCSKYL